MIKNISEKKKAWILFTLLFFINLFILSIADIGWKKGAYKCIQSVLFLLAIYGTLGGKKIRILVLGILSINILNLSYYNYIYGKVDAGTILSILGTNFSETAEFLQTLDFVSAIKAIFITLIYSVTLFYAFNSLDKIKPKKYKIILPFILAYIAFFSGKVIKEKNNKLDVFVEKSIKFLGQDVNTHYVSAFARYNYLVSKYSKDIKNEWKNVEKVKSKQKDIYLVFIGESARKDAYGLYSEKFNTTPKLSELSNVLVVKEPISPAVQTRESVIRSLALNYKEKVDFDRNLIDLANLSGFKTYWLSNQSQVGQNDTTITSIAKRSSEYVFLNNGHYRKSGKDIQLIKNFNTILDKNNSKKIVFFHTMGSHNSFCARVWNHVKINNIEDKDQCYYNSIHNGYELIETALNIVRERELSYSAVYFSDHALVRSSKSPYFVHGAGKMFRKDAVDVPLIFFFDKKIDKKIISKRYFLRDFTHTFAHWIGVKADGIDYSKSILSETFTTQENYIMNSDYKFIGI